MLTPCLDLLQFREVPFALVFFTSSTQSALQLISKNVGPSFLLWTLLVEIVPHLKVLHEHLLSLVTPIHITDALLIIVKVPHMPGPVLAQHLVPTISAHVANGKSFLNLLSLLLSLPRNLVFLLLLMGIDRVTTSISHVLTIFNIITILKAINLIQPIKFPNHVLNFQSPS